jgi:predicted enzyme related to lactoylglutathione lyase
MTLRWLTAFLDLPEQTYDAGSGFWSTVTGWERSAQRGPDGQFATLVPPDGTDYLRLQRLDEGPRLHCDLHVDDLSAASAAAQELGGEVLDGPFDDVTTMRSPGGFVFCFVPGGTGRRPAPTAWPDGHTSYVDQVCLDIPPRLYDAEMDFWSAVTGWARRDPEPGSEFGRLTPGPEQPLQLLMQRLDDEQDVVTAHLDWATTGREAEIERHVAAGAELQKSFAGWTVLRDPAGMTYCITGRTAGDRPR